LAQAISWTKFPPLGVGGFGLQPTHLNYEKAAMPEIIAHMNEHVMVVLQIETVTALNRVDELLAVPGVDVVMVGPADLSVSLGVPGQFEHPSMIEAIGKIRDACNRNGIAPGIPKDYITHTQYWRDTGIKIIT
jgi:2-dehydro-3-deoxyglucarate aldolase/4-hydroxy-2-oxoheptanedioate aldolase